MTLFGITLLHWKVALALALALDARMMFIPRAAPLQAAVKPEKLKLLSL
jgi:hypothetical protein